MKDESVKSLIGLQKSRRLLLLLREPAFARGETWSEFRQL